MNCLVVGDLHLKLLNLKVATLLFDYLHVIIDKLDKKVILVFLGDIYDVKSIIRVEVQNFFYSQLSKLSSKVDKIAIVLGNHDYTNLNLIDHSFNFDCDKIIPNLVVVSGTTQIADKIYATPYNNSVESFIKDLPPNMNLFFCHQSINGFKYNLSIDMIENQGVDSDKIKAQTIIAGHFHCFQQNKNVIYLGSPFAHSFGEANQEKKIMLIKEDYSIEYFSTKDIVPQYYNVVVSVDNLMHGKININYNEQDHVKFIIKDMQQKCQKITKQFLMSLMEQHKIPFTHNIYIQYDFIDNVIDICIDENQSILKMFTDYVNLYLRDYEDREFVLQLGKKKYLEQNLRRN